MDTKDMVLAWCGMNWIILGVIQEDKFLIKVGIVWVATVCLNGMFFKFF